MGLPSKVRAYERMLAVIRRVSPGTYATVLALVASGFIITVLSAGTIEEQVDVKYFYKYDGTGNPGGVEPNWYYYWSQTKANKGSHQYDPSHPEWYGSYRRGDIFFKIHQHASGTNDVTGHSGIDCFAETCMHELVHLGWWWKFWPSGYVSSQDPDGDHIPTDWEIRLDLDPNDSTTNPDPEHPDWDDFTIYTQPLANQSEKTWVAGSADSEDWSTLGNQYSAP